MGSSAGKHPWIPPATSPLDEIPPRELGELGLVIAADLERRGYIFADVVAELARRWLAQLVAAAEELCPGCGGPIVQPVRGRRRRLCSRCSPSRHGKRRKKAKLA